MIFGSGREEFFDKQSDGSFQPVDPRIHSALVKNGDGTYALTTKDNQTYDFTAQGVMQRVEDLNGNSLEMAYNGQGLLSSVTGAGGTALTLTYDPQGRL